MSDNNDQKIAALAAAATAAPGGAQPENLLRSIETFMTSVIGEQLTAMLDSADEILFEMSEKAANSEEQRLYFDTLRVIRIERARMLRTFQDNLQQSFASGRNERAAANIDIDDMDTWAVQSSEETEERVVTANLESRASALYQQELFELENRLEALAEKDHETVTPKLIAPAQIFDAFRNTMKGMEVEFPVKLVIYRLAERALLGNLKQVYTGANQMLEARGYAPAQRHVGGSRAAEPSAAVRSALGESAVAHTGDATQGWAPPQPPSGPAAWPSGMSASRLLEGLSSAAGYGGGTQGYTDGQLANDIGAMLDGMAHGRQQQSWIPPANIALTGQMFDSLYQDRQLAEPVRPLLRRLQLPVMKTALADPEFFKNARHPMRKMVHEIYDMLSSADTPTEQEVARLSDLINHLLQQFEVAPARLSRPEGRAPAVSDEEAVAFLAEQKERLASHRARTLEKVRRLVSQELKLRTALRQVPETVMPLLLSGFGPLLAVNALRGGVNGIPWKDSLALLERLLDSIEPDLPPDQHQSAVEADIVTSATERLIGIGLPHEKVQRLVTALLDIYQAQAIKAVAAPEPPAGAAVSDDTPVAPAPPPPPKISPEVQAAAAAQQALGAILTLGSWFQVWDEPNNQRRWLKLSAYIPGRDAVVFDDFMAEHHLRIHASTLIRDLIEGRSAPVDPNPAVQRSMKLLAPLAAMLPVSVEPAIWQPAATAAVH